jgi:anthranilate phosphoribosyltransferase
MEAFKPFIAIAASGKPLSRADAEQAFTMMMSGEATPSQIGGFLMALRVRGETVDELAGAVTTLRAKMLPVSAPAHAMDIVGTGGDASGSYNVSTAAAFVVAAAGVPVAKHGNRALSSKSGSADVLKALGVNLELDAKAISCCIDEAGIGFMFAPAHHAAMKFVGPSRVELGTRTIFNLLGPLANPAGVKRQLLGVFSADWLLPIAETLRDLGAENVWVVHGDGLDEITTTGETKIVTLEDGAIGHLTVKPEEFGLKRATKDQLTGGDAAHNANALRRMLAGTPGPYRDIVVMNAAAALVISGKAADMDSGVALAAHMIDNGAALGTLERLVDVSNRVGPHG